MNEIPLPTVPQRLVDTKETLEGVCAHLEAAGRFAFDTEFIGENSYHPVLCLVQVATEERVELIDPIAVRDLSPLWDLMGRADIEKILHAGEQDLAIVYQQGRTHTRNIFDSQIAGGMIGVGYPLAYWRLVEMYCGVELDKAHTFSAWDRRPLSGQQFHYAVDDVRYLLRVHDAMRARLGALGRADWQRQACDELSAQAAKRVDPQMIFSRIKGAAQLSGPQLAALRELTVLREQWAYEHDVLPRTMLKDEAMMDLALKMPRRVEDLERVRTLPREEIVSYGAEIVAAVARGRACPPEQQPRMGPPGEDSTEIRRMADTLWAAANIICVGQSVTPALVTSQAEMASLARRVVLGRDLNEHVLMSGWHRECLGEPLAKLVRGELRLRVKMEAGNLWTEFERGERGFEGGMDQAGPRGG